MYDRIRRIFNSPSRRHDGDYSKQISPNAILGVLLVYRDYISPNGSGYSSYLHQHGLRKTIRDLGHLYHSFASVNWNGDLGVIADFLDQERSAAAFLDFLEISLHNAWEDDNFVRTINAVLEEYDSPYLITEYISRKVPVVGEHGSNYTRIEIVSYPRAYLRHETEVQKQAIEPALLVLSEPAYKTPDKDFRAALRRQREGDYDGCVTACASAVEGTIKVTAAKMKLRKLRGNGLEAIAQSFTSNTSLPNSARLMFRPLATWRNTQSDAHGHAKKNEISEELARHFIADSASLITLIQSQSK